jgi:predicted nucleic acid-binding protein
VREKVVIDASVAVKWVLPEEGTSQALALRDRFEFQSPELIIPEMSNILWKKCRRGELLSEEVNLCVQILMNSGIEYVTMRAHLEAATHLAIQLDHPAHDCMYLVLSQQTALRFVTADARLSRKLRQMESLGIGCFDLADTDRICSLSPLPNSLCLS